MNTVNSNDIFGANTSAQFSMSPSWGRAKV
jgi:hypothetical protein